MATYDDAHHVVTISDEEVRSGVTGHNVRYVLAFGMTGVILAFAAIALYFGFDALQERLTAALAHSPFELVRALATYAMTLLVGAIAIGLLLGWIRWATGSTTLTIAMHMVINLEAMIETAIKVEYLS